MHADAAFPGVIEVVVEIPRGSRNKDEFDERAVVFGLDRDAWPREPRELREPGGGS